VGGMINGKRRCKGEGLRIKRDRKGRRERDGRSEIGKGRKGREGCLPIRLCMRPCMTRVRHPRPPQWHHLGRGLGGG
jgi:hypothetical protein